MDEVSLGGNTVKVGYGKILDATADSTNALIVNATGEALVKPTANSQVDLNKVAGTTTSVNNGTVDAGTQRVTIASNGTGKLSTVDTITNPVAATQSGSWTNTVTQGTATNLKAQAESYQGGTAVSSSNPLEVNIRSATGSAITVPRLNKSTQITTITNTTETTVLTAVASTYLDVYGVIISNTSATATDVNFKDSTSGTTRFTIYVPAGDTRGFMLPVDGAHNQATLNNNWTATCGAGVSSIKITMLAVKNT